ncbi:MAG TPA: TonB family protein [Anaeromyxobacteraceae bacterium]|nr:TonB family protein [Anaeromyxobacteraceae bacterium]
MTTAAPATPTLWVAPALGHRRLLLCLAGSILAHAAFAYLSSVWSPPAPAAGHEPIVIETWPEPQPTPPVEPLPAAPEVHAQPEPVSRPLHPEARAQRPVPSEGDVSRAVQHKGILKAFASLGGAARLAPTAAGDGLPPRGLAPAPPTSGSTGPSVLDRGGSGPAGPATLDGIHAPPGIGSGTGSGTGGALAGLGVVGTGSGAVYSSAVSEGEVSAFVRARTGSIKACYESQLRRDPTLQGRIRVRFRIQTDGSISQLSTIENTFGSPELESCVFQVIRAWHTPFRPSEAADVEYPFVFSLK